MSYSKQGFTNGNTLTAAQLIKMEEGIIDAESSGGSSTITVDSALSSTSTNPVQNKVIYNAIPTSLKCPNALTINGTSYDGSKAVSMTISGGSGSTVSVSQKLTSGTNIADITVGSTTTKIYAPTVTNDFTSTYKNEVDTLWSDYQSACTKMGVSS